MKLRLNEDVFKKRHLRNKCGDPVCGGKHWQYSTASPANVTCLKCKRRKK